MLIKFIHSIAGENYRFGKGEIVDLPNGQKYIDSGNAVAVNPDLPKGIQEPIKEPEIKMTVIKKTPSTRKKAKK